jgi:hypothetical protein
MGKKQMTQPDPYEKAFFKYPIEVQKGSLFYFVRKDDGSYVVAVLNTQSHKLYTLEWVM